jgi:hypothetical protein
MSTPGLTFRIASFIAWVCAGLILLCALGIITAIAVGSAQPVLAVTIMASFYDQDDVLVVDLQRNLVVSVPMPFDSTPVYSPDGQTLIGFRDNQRAAFDVRTRRLWPLPGAGSSVAAWSGDGRYFAYNNLDHDALYIWDARLGVAQAIGFDSIISVMYWSPRHDRLIIVSATRLVTVDVAAGRITALTPPEIMVCPTVTWSPDQAHVVMGARAGEHYFNRVIDARSGHVSAQVQAQHCASFARWSPDASRLLIQTWRGYAVWNPARSDYSELELLSNAAGFMKIGDPVWSPDSRWLAFARAAYQPLLDPRAASVSAPELVITDLTQSHIWPLPAAGQVNLSWSPDGRWVAGQITDAGHHSRLTLFPANGSESRPVESPLFHVVPLGWMHDNRLAAYAFTTNEYLPSGPETALELLMIDPGSARSRRAVTTVDSYLFDVILWPQEQD